MTLGAEKRDEQKHVRCFDVRDGTGGEEAEAEAAALKEQVVAYHADQAKKKAHADAHPQFAYLPHPVAIDGPIDLTDAPFEPLERVLFSPPAAIPAGARERPANYRSDDADYANLGDDECETAKEIDRLMAEHL
eukprot:CAMPEP_0179937632 /NCGR_PEP_ID=MMETSP0983-20121128/14443_1 /TAXON_ID=483367 /ORGANISM="non described non described, Strain CCMP 2436" /LENGTH=133 /DNA_ID=CAMNT_0021843393 /DNA_START=390 /DNA_END=789 /DNA_ORIENTATION=-